MSVWADCCRSCVAVKVCIIFYRRGCHDRKVEVVHGEGPDPHGNDVRTELYGNERNT